MPTTGTARPGQDAVELTRFMESDHRVERAVRLLEGNRLKRQGLTWEPEGWVNARVRFSLARSRGLLKIAFVFDGIWDLPVGRVIAEATTFEKAESMVWVHAKLVQRYMKDATFFDYSKVVLGPRGLARKTEDISCSRP